MTRKVIISVLCCSVFLSACASTDGENFFVTPSQLNADPERFDGKSVALRGLVKMGPEAHILFESKAIDDEFQKQVRSSKGNVDVRKYQKYCLTIINPGLLSKNMDAVNGKTLVIKGKFAAHYSDQNIIDLGACALPSGIVVDQTDLSSRYSYLLKNK